MGARILIADDSVTIQKVVELTFSREDFVLIPARSGEEAIRKAKEARPDLMLIDVVMPDRNGYDVCRALREDPLLKATPIILLTGAFETFDKNEGLKVGANDFVAKPFESQTLISKVKQLLPSQGALTAPQPPVPRAAGPVTVIEEEVSPPSAPAPFAGTPAMAAPAAVSAGSPAPALEPVSETVFELREEFLPEPPPAAPAAAAPPPPPGEEPALPVPALPEDAGASARPELQELSLDDLTVEEPLGAVDVSPVDLERVESVRGAAALPAAAPEALSEPAVVGKASPDPAAPTLEMEPGAIYPDAEPSLSEAPVPPGGPAVPELDLDLLASAAPAVPLYELEPMELEPAAPSRPPPALGTEELLRELESAAGSPQFGEPMEPAATFAPPVVEVPGAPWRIVASPVPTPEAPGGGAAPPAEPLAATPLAADGAAARLAAELAPHLSREIVERIVERIERVVWEVVPDLAEALIARELDRIKERAERRSAP